MKITFSKSVKSKIVDIIMAYLFVHDINSSCYEIIMQFIIVELNFSLSIIKSHITDSTKRTNYNNHIFFFHLKRLGI